MRWQTTDEVFIRAPRKVIARRILDLADDASWWPGARASGPYGYVVVRAPVGRAGSRVSFGAVIGPLREWEGFTWTLNAGEIVGRAEWWLEPFNDGTIVHYYLDVERGPRARWRRTGTCVRRHRWAVRRGLDALKDSVERVAARDEGRVAARDGARDGITGRM